MKTGIIGLPQTGKSSLFRILTKAKLDDRGYSNPKEVHVGVARVPDDRLDRLAALYKPKKTVYATVEYADMAAIGKESLKEANLIASLRNVDALMHVLRAEGCRCSASGQLPCLKSETWGTPVFGTPRLIAWLRPRVRGGTRAPAAPSRRAAQTPPIEWSESAAG